MTKMDLIAALAYRQHITIRLARSVMENILDIISQELIAGKPVKIRNFGTLTAQKQNGECRARFILSNSIKRKIRED